VNRILSKNAVDSPVLLAPAEVPGQVRPATSSPRSFDESRAFLEERIAKFSRLVFLLSTTFFGAGWLIAQAWEPSSEEYRLPPGASQLFHLGSMTVLLAMWMVTRCAELSLNALRRIDAAGTVLASLGTIGACFSIPAVQRPELLTLLSLFPFLLYRAAIVPSEPRRTAWIGVCAAAPVVLMTYMLYTRESPAHRSLSPWVNTVQSLLFGAVAVLLSSAIARVTYRLRRTAREVRRLGPYTLVTRIGEGGMGTVYRARHALLRRPTAIKILKPERATDVDLARFEREVQATSLLTSAHTISIFDYGRTPDALFYYVMEYIDGIDLEQLVQRDGPMPPGRVVAVLSQVSEALSEAHAAGLIHRDVKPANILLSVRGGRPDFAKVADFGIAKDLGGNDTVTAENLVPGTPAYMAPETLQAPDRVDARSDVYALGATAYFLLTGEPVFAGRAMEILAQLLQDEPVPLSKRLGRPVPASLEALVLSALAKDPDDRPESAVVFSQRLAACSDIPAWTAAEAAAWWRGRGESIKKKRSSDLMAAESAA